MKFRKLAKCSLAVALVFGAANALTGCGKDDDNNIQTEKTEQEKVYDLYVSYMSAQGQIPLTYQEWVNSIKGVKGDKGDKGDPGTSWLTGNGAPSTQGENGDFYYDRDTNKIYHKDDGAWGLVTALVDGAPGKAGNGIASIKLTSTIGNVDTYTITFTDNNVAPVTFNVTNGSAGASVDGVEINSAGELLIDLSNRPTPINVGKVKGDDGADLTIAEVSTTTGNNEDTYKLTYSDGNYLEFSVKHGKDGTTWLNGEGAPAVAAKDGDFYFDRINNDIYLYDGGWVLEVDLPVNNTELRVLEDGEYTGTFAGYPFVATIENHLISSIEIEGLPTGTVVSNYGYDITDGIISISIDATHEIAPGQEETQTMVSEFVLNGTELDMYVSDEEYELIRGQYYYADYSLTVTSNNIYYSNGTSLLKGSYKIIESYPEYGWYTLRATIDENKEILLELDVFNRYASTEIEDFSGEYVLETTEGNVTINYDQEATTLTISDVEVENLQVYGLPYNPTGFIALFDVDDSTMAYELDYMSSSVTRIGTTMNLPFVGETIALTSDFDCTSIPEAYYMIDNNELVSVNNSIVYQDSNYTVRVDLEDLSYTIMDSENHQTIYRGYFMDLPEPDNDVITITNSQYSVSISLNTDLSISALDIQVPVNVYDEDSLRQALSEGAKNIIVSQDITLSSPIQIKSDVNIDGNDCTIKASAELAPLIESDDDEVYTLFYIADDVEVSFNNITLDGNQAGRAITAINGHIKFVETNVTNGLEKGVYRSGGAFIGYSASFTMKSGSILGNMSSVESEELTAENYYLYYSADLWIGANAVGNVVSIEEGAQVGRVFVNANEYSANNPGSFTLNGGSIDTIYIEYDSGYGATFDYQSGYVREMIISTETSGNAFEPINEPTPGTVYHGGEEIIVNE